MNSKTMFEKLSTMLQRARIIEKEASSALKNAQQDIQALERTLSLLQSEEGVQTRHIGASTLPDLNALRGGSLTQRRKEGLKVIARANHGTLIVKDCGVPMVEAGLFQVLNRFRTQIYTVISEMDCWKKLEAGVYILDEEPQSSEVPNDSIMSSSELPVKYSNRQDLRGINTTGDPSS